MFCCSVVVGWTVGLARPREFPVRTESDLDTREVDDCEMVLRPYPLFLLRLTLLFRALRCFGSVVAGDV